MKMFKGFFMGFVLLFLPACALEGNSRQKPKVLAKWSVEPHPRPPVQLPYKPNAKSIPPGSKALTRDELSEFSRWLRESGLRSDEWAVSVGSRGQLQVELRRPRPNKEQPKSLQSGLARIMRKPGLAGGRTVILKQGEGWLVGLNAGEFGGGLWWIGNTGAPALISDRPITDLVEHNGRVFVATGLPTNVYSIGSLGEIRRPDNNHWDLHTIIDLPEGPATFSPCGKQTWLVATGCQLLRLERMHKSARIEVLARPNWYRLDPNSIAVPKAGRFAFIGMRGYVARFDLKTHKMTYFSPPNAEELRKQAIDGWELD